MMRAARTRAEREQHANAWAVWHVAVLSRAKKIPDFDKFVTPSQAPAPARQSKERVQMNLKMLAAAWGAKAH